MHHRYASYMHHSIIDIFIGYLTGWVRFKVPGPFGPQK